MARTTGRLGDIFRTILSVLTCAAVLLCPGLQSSTADAAGNVARQIDVAHSSMKVYVGKEGLFAFASDEHQVNAPIESGSLDEATNSIELTIDATKMRVLDPPSRRGKVQANMLGPQVLDVAKYPKISFRSTGVATTPQPEKDGATKLWTIKGDLTLHGQTHPISVFAKNFGPTRFTGSARFKQSTFGITPIKVVGGSVRVKDEVEIVFDITLK